MAKVVKYVTYNVNGLNGTVKRKCVLGYLKKFKTDIAFIQESYLTSGEHKKLKKEWVGQVYHCSIQKQEGGYINQYRAGQESAYVCGKNCPPGSYVLIQGVCTKL